MLEVNLLFYVFGEMILMLEILIANISLSLFRQSMYCKTRACLSPGIFEILKMNLFFYGNISTIDFFVTADSVF